MAISNEEDIFLAAAIAEYPLTPDSFLYLVRSKDEVTASQTILDPGALVRIRGSCAMGKTSLIHRLLQTASDNGCKTVRLSLNEISPAACQDLDDFLLEFCRQVGDALQIPHQLDNYWDDFFGSTICCKSYFEEYLLPQISGPLLLALDDVDRLFPFQDLADDFFGLLRAWHEDAKTRDIWRQLRLIVAYSTDLYVPRNINKSPFNVGLPIELAPFSLEQVRTLVERWQVSLSQDEILSLTQFVGGRPQLVQLFCYALCRNGGNLGGIIESAFAADSPFAKLLQQVQQALAAQPELNATLAAIAAGQPLTCLNAVTVYRLDSLGLVRVTGQQVQFSCELYAQWVASW